MKGWPSVTAENLPGRVELRGEPGEPACVGDGRALIELLTHEVRTPLNAVRGFAELLLAGGGGALSGEALDYLRQISRGGRLLESAFDHLRELAAAALDGPGEPGPVDLGGCLAACGVPVGSAELPPIAGDRRRWRQAIEAACFYLRAGEGEGVPLVAALEPAPGGGLVLTLACADARPEHGIGALALLLARRLAAAEGVALELPGPGRLRLVRAPAPVGHAGWQANCRSDGPGAPEGLNFSA